MKASTPSDPRRAGQTSGTQLRGVARAPVSSPVMRPCASPPTEKNARSIPRRAGADGGVAAEAQGHAESQRVEGQAAQHDARPGGRKRSGPERQAPGDGEHGPEHAERHG